MLNKISFVLIETSHPGNIGAAARAIKTMGLNKLSLVNPVEYPSVKATARASGADDVLAQAGVFSSVQQAIAKSTLVIGTSARDRRLAWPVLTPTQMAEVIFSHISTNPEHQVGLLFGRENNGLSNEELELCHYLVQIPANPAYSSLNIAAAVQILAYEIRSSYLLSKKQEEQTLSGNATEMDSPMACHDSLDRMYEHLFKLLYQIDFINEKQPIKLIRRIKRLFNKAQMEEKEVQIIRGILSAVEKNLKCKSE